MYSSLHPLPLEVDIISLRDGSQTLNHRSTAQSAQKPEEYWGRVPKCELPNDKHYITIFRDVRGYLKRAVGNRRALKRLRTAPAYHPVSQYSSVLIITLAVVKPIS